jgi:glycosyltransferase involved in cell wall biosynthesis
MAHRTTAPANDLPRGEAIALGVFPPPVTGMTLCTERVTKALESAGPVRRLNLSSGAALITLGFRLRKLARLLAALPQLLFHRRRAQRVVLYMPCNRGLAMYYNLAAAAIARFRGFRVALHHHGYNYLNRYDWRVKLIDRVMGPGSVHLVLCPHMVDALRQRYTPRAQTQILPSTILLEEGPLNDPLATRAPHTSLRIGHLSNLSHAKGIDHVLNLFDWLAVANRNVSLVLAGPATDDVARQSIAACLAKYGDRVQWLGPVYSAEKEKFFRQIDLFLLPSRNEAQPVVISEAFSSGKPVIAFGRSCIPGLFGPHAAGDIPPTGDFVEPAAKLIEGWLADPTEYERQVRLAKQRAIELHGEAQVCMQQFVQWALE